MISEKNFAEGFTGFWTECLPFLTPQLIGELNLSGSPMPNSNGFVVKPMKAAADSSNNDVIAEIAFGLFAAACSRNKAVVTILKDTQAVKSIITEATERIRILRRLSANESSAVAFSTNDAIELALRLDCYFDHESYKTLTVQPRFKGCGIMDSCYGDLLCDDRLYEVKMVDRNLRSVDLRQLLIYCALNYQARQFQINTACVINPRRGIAFRFDLEVLAQRLARKNSAELLHQICDFLGNFEAIHQAS
jgi:hypothetical protein